MKIHIILSDEDFKIEMFTVNIFLTVLSSFKSLKLREVAGDCRHLP